jgi:hypothetical protein
MGKFATYAKRGAPVNPFPFGQFPSGGWTWAGLSTTSMRATRLAGFFPGFDRWTIRWRLTSGGAFTQEPTTTGTQIDVLGLTPATSYTAQAAFFSGTTQVSDWSDVKVASTL